MTQRMFIATARWINPVTPPTTTFESRIKPPETSKGVPAATGKPAARAGSNALRSAGPPPKMTWTPRARQMLARQR